jgi:hypothetical protein
MELIMAVRKLKKFGQIYYSTFLRRLAQNYFFQASTGIGVDAPLRLFPAAELPTDFFYLHIH